jgi:hypothetical protein
MNVASTIRKKGISSHNETEKWQRNNAYISPSGSRKIGGAAPQRPARTHTVFACMRWLLFELWGLKTYLLTL